MRASIAVDRQMLGLGWAFNSSIKIISIALATLAIATRTPLRRAHATAPWASSGQAVGKQWAEDASPPGLSASAAERPPPRTHTAQQLPRAAQRVSVCRLAW